MRNNRNHEVASERECFTHYELIDNLARHQEGHGTTKIEIKTMTGQEYTFECRGKTMGAVSWFQWKNDPTGLGLDKCP